MKLQKFYTLAAAALLIGAGSAQAQTSNFASTVGPLDNLNHDCVIKEARGNQVLLLKHGDVVTQSFTACENGVVEKVYISIKQSSDYGKLHAFIQDAKGENIIDFKQDVKAGQSGILVIKLPAPVKAGQVYNLKLRAFQSNIVLEGQYGQSSDNALHLNGWKLDGNITTAVGIRKVVETPGPVSDTRNPESNEVMQDRATEFHSNFLVYPNPFVDNIKVTFKRKFKDETHVMLTDLSGNVLQRVSIREPLQGQMVELNPAYDLRPGAYALRIISENRVYNQTLMKY